ncbi:unnamed protein product [Acanthoscelides obtectus]|uniref:Uncharacterized protein n=1 Tax=Acanthoscelides obtectus TaxID=200917 RepID=A0A9P0KZC9_ACAOB|nr:unnamed protein product [Acanthoscelides obtectus]CAK1653131.1 hypothetical protein AOBTE_LOCUS18080 [Acanthoscelides obtectus]
MSRNKEKVSGIFRRLFRSATREGEGPSKAGANGGAGSPARHRFVNITKIFWTCPFGLCVPVFEFVVRGLEIN